MKHFKFLLLFVLIITGCTQNSNVIEEPETVLHTYFNSLYNQKYDKVVQYYGGEYDLLQGYHPLIDPNNYEKLMRSFIEITGGQLVRIDKIIEMDEVQSEEYIFKVTFKDNPYIDSNKIYSYTVKKVNGKYKVMDLPPYLA